MLREKQSEMEAKLEAASEELKERKEEEKARQAQSVRSEAARGPCIYSHK